MTTKDYTQAWRESPDSQKIRQSSIDLATSVCRSKGLEKHKKELLSCLVWKATEDSGKHNTRYVSEGVLNGGHPIEHEHVFTRKNLVDRMLNNPEDIETVINSAVACLVTKEEHSRLSKIKDCDGWGRYRVGGIKIYDRLRGEWKKNYE